MNENVPQSRGYTSIQEVVAKMRPLAEWYAKNKPKITTLTLARKDYDLVARWPKAAELCDFYTANGELRYRWTDPVTKNSKTFTLTFDKTERRYEKDVAIVTTQSEEDRRFGQPNYGHDDDLTTSEVR